jgi:molybdopterin converting factor small subunit
MITVRLPAMLRGDDGTEELRIEEGVATVAQLVAALERVRPDLREPLHDSLYNFAVNDALVLHGADDYPLAHGDVVEIIPTIAGG